MVGSYAWLIIEHNDGEEVVVTAFFNKEVAEEYIILIKKLKRTMVYDYYITEIIIN